MQKIFTKYLWGVITLALMFVLLLSYVQQTRFAQERMQDGSKIKFEQIALTLKNNQIELKNLTSSLQEDYLTRARAFAYIIEKNPAVLDSEKELERIKTLLNVDELHVIDENGILIAGSIPKYFGMDFRTTKQTAEFLKILEDPSEYLVQDIQPNGAEKKIFQYVGVARQDTSGIVQVGLAPTRILEAQSRNELPYILSRIPLDEGGSLFAIDAKTNTVIVHSNREKVGKTMKELGYEDDYLEKYQKGGFHVYNGKKSYIVLSKTDEIILGMGQLEENLYVGRTQQMILIFICLLITFLFLIYFINRLLQRQIVDGIHRIMRDLTEITKGNLKRIVKVNNNPEFIELSTGINKMVQSILDENIKVSQIIDMVDLPIGVFEFQNAGNIVLATDRLRHILLWNEKEANSYYDDKNLFLQKLKEYMQNPETEESDIYEIRKSPSKWLQIRMNTNHLGTFGVVTDVTMEIDEKRRICHERDYDALTGLCNFNIFKKRVGWLLNQDEDLGISAMVMLDLDYFKNVNDQYGHDWGDAYLRIAAKHLSALEGENTIAARRSGDEFCLFLFGFQSRAELLGHMDNLYENVRREAIITPNGTKENMGISSGMAWHDSNNEDFAVLLHNADVALYDAKNGGRGILREYNG